MPRDYWTYTDQYAAQILPQNHEPFLLIKAEELFTPEGHMLLLGTKFGEMFQRDGVHLQDILQAIKDRREITRIADHPFYRSGLGAKENLEKFEHEIHAYEENSLASRTANQKARTWATEHRKPLLANSDAHIPSNIGNGYNRFAQLVLDYDSGFDLLRSLNEAIKGKRFTSVFRQSGPWEKAHHSAMVLSDHYWGLSRWACAPDGFDLEQAREVLN